MSAPHRPTAPKALRALPGPRRGMGAVAVIMVLVVMAVLAAAILRLGRQTHTATQQDLQGQRAQSAVRAGLEWGLFQAFKGSWTSCSAASQTLDLSADMGMRVALSCNSTLYNEGESSPGVPVTVRIFTIDAVACNGSVGCPDATAVSRTGYVERRRQIQAQN